MITLLSVNEKYLIFRPPLECHTSLIGCHSMLWLSVIIFQSAQESKIVRHILQVTCQKKASVCVHFRVYSCNMAINFFFLLISLFWVQRCVKSQQWLPPPFNNATNDVWTIKNVEWRRGSMRVDNIIILPNIKKESCSFVLFFFKLHNLSFSLNQPTVPC